ncbi:MAG: DUF362 domain-containing protein [Candidatus Bathyarchaeia archaeon]
MSEVFFQDYNRAKDVLEGLEKLFLSSGLASIIPKGGSVAVKVHMGEKGNITYLRPSFARKIVELIKEAGGIPFVTDTTALYPKGRFTARDYLETAAFNGFTAETMGAPIIIADGDKGYDGTPVKIEKRVDGCTLKDVKVASAILKADALVVLSHFKGHVLSGVGGAIKNLAMGCTTKEGKAAQHAMNPPTLDEAKCNACGVCVDVCPFQALTLKGGMPSRNLQKCMYCSECLFKCPQSALYWPKGAKEKFQVYMAHAAYGVITALNKLRVGYLNFIQDVTPQCDCCTPAGQPLTWDVGVLASLDPVAIDKASLDIVDQAPLFPSLPAVSPPDLLGKINGTNSLIHIRTAEKLGAGSLEYRLKAVGDE